MLRKSAFGILLAAAIVGCSGPPAADHTFRDAKGGVTTADGKPVNRASMKFEPLDTKTGRDDVCLVENGRYTAKLMAGKYKVSFEALPGGTPIPKKYTSPTTSTLEIDATKDVEANFELK